MRPLRACTVGLAAVLATLSASAAPAQDWPDFLEPMQLFRVIVQGVDAGGSVLQPVKGTAWAVAPGVLITADHVTGRAQNYQNASSSDKVFIPRRSVVVEVSAGKSFEGDDPKKYPDGIVTTSPFESIDAARIGFSDLKARAFDLSACDIAPNTTYRVLKFNDGNVFQPKPVSITLKSYGRSKLGDAGSVVVMSGARGAIREGDSGSPVLDADNRVVGLVSAINEDSGDDIHDEVHVTLVKSFLDLIPLQIGETEFLDIPCSDRIRLQRVDGLTLELAEANKAVAALVTEKNALARQFADLERRHDVLLRQVNTLLWNQHRLGREAERRAAIREETAPDGFDQLPLWKQNDYFWGKNQETFNNKISDRPLRPTVTKISSELGSPTWRLTGSISSTNDVAINLDYERTLSGTPYALNMMFCLIPIVWDVPEGTPADQDPSHRKFYEPREGPFEEGHEALEFCDPVSHTAQDGGGADPDSVRKGQYNWTRTRALIGAMKRVVKQQYPDRDWDGTYYLQIFEPVPAGGTDPVTYRLHTRAFVDLVRDAGGSNEGTALPCKIFKDGPSLIEAVADSKEDLTGDTECAQDT